MGCFVPSTQIQNYKRTHFLTEKIVKKNSFKKISVFSNKRIGTGASSEIYLVKTEPGNKYYAFKIIKKNINTNNQQYNYFRSNLN